MKKKLKVAIVYDRVNKFGGAERVLLSLRQLFPDSVLFTSVFDKQAAAWVGDWEVRTSFLQKIPFANKHHEWLALLMPLAFESLDLSGFDLIISVTSEFAKNIITTPDQRHVCYCLTPTRYLWSHTREYSKGSLFLVKQFLFSHLRRIDYLSAARPQKMIAISGRVRDRIHQYYGRSAKVIYPPLTLLTSEKKRNRRDYYLVVSRLVPYKRIDLAISACIRYKRHLHIVGTGSQGVKLFELAGNSPYIHFDGSVSDDKLNQLYQKARALICPQDEDFGLVSLEAQAHGVPVISFANSGIAETIIERKTGVLFAAQTAVSLGRALKTSESIPWDPKTIVRQARKFNEKRFWREFKDAVQ